VNFAGKAEGARVPAFSRPNLTLFRRSGELMKFSKVALSAFLAATMVAAEEPGTSVPGTAPKAESSISADELYSLGKNLFDTYAPDTLREEYDFISRESWEGLVAHLTHALESGSFSELADCVPELRSALAIARSTPGGAEWIDWLNERLDLAEAAGDALHPTTPPSSLPPAVPPGTTPKPRPSPLPPAALPETIPHFALWQKRIAGRPLPDRARELMPTLKSVFAGEGIPPALAWLVEVESSFNPLARSPAGAKGLFQFMPATAQSLGLSTLLPDERTNPVKSAQAAAQYLRALHRRFADWPLVLAAYNAGEGRVGRALTSRRGKTFADASSALPTETQLYVPKVLATIAHREGIDPLSLPAPLRLGLAAIE